MTCQHRPQNDKARDQDHVKETKKVCLVRVRTQHGIKEKEAKNENGRKRKLNEEQRRRKLMTPLTASMAFG